MEFIPGRVPELFLYDAEGKEVRHEQHQDKGWERGGLRLCSTW